VSANLEDAVSGVLISGALISKVPVSWSPISRALIL
jgi:hypothetical protein